MREKGKDMVQSSVSQLHNEVSSYRLKPINKIITNILFLFTRYDMPIL